MEERKFADLHLHLDGAITVDIAKKLAKLQNIKIESDDKKLLEMLSVPKDCRSLDEFLTCFSLPLSLMQTEEGIETAVELVQENIKRQNVVYAELRFAPQLHCEKGLTQRKVVEAALRGLAKSDLPCNLILCCMRGNDNMIQNKETVDLAAEFLKRDPETEYGVVALDLAGAEGIFKTKDYAGLFASAKKLGVPFTIHAGEADGAQSVKDAISFGAGRIGHGVKSVTDKQVMAELADKDICVEMCLTSNLQTKAISGIEEFPIKTFIQNKIPVTINTDDMAICRTTMEEEMNLVGKNFGFSRKEERKLFENAIKYSFAKDITKKRILADKN